MGTPGPIVVRKEFGLDVVYVSDAFSLRKLLGLTGTTLDQTFVSPLPTELSLVQSLWDDGTHFITTNFITNLVQVWDPATKHVVMTSQTFQVPMNAISFQGELAVAETGRRCLVRIDPVTHHMDVIANDLAIGLPATVGRPPTGKVLTGVTVSPSGTIYVAGDVDNVVYRIQKTH